MCAQHNESHLFLTRRRKKFLPTEEGVRQSQWVPLAIVGRCLSGLGWFHSRLVSLRLFRPENQQS